MGKRRSTRSSKNSGMGCLGLIGVILLLLIIGGIRSLFWPAAPSSHQNTDLARTTNPTRQVISGGSASAPVAAPTATIDAELQAAGELPSPGQYFYAGETSHSVTSFGDVYRDLGGVLGLGYPLTEPFVERSAADGKWRWVQYFEKAVIEYHPDLQGANRFQLAALGAARLTEKYTGGAALPASKAVPGKSSYKFSETGHTVRGVFLQRWHEGG